MAKGTVDCLAALRNVCDSLDEKIEEEEKESEAKQDRTPVDAATGEASQTAKETSRRELEAGLFAKTAETADDRVANQASANGAHFVIHPCGNIPAVIPEQDRAVSKQHVSQNGKKTQSGARTPVHACPLERPATYTNYDTGRGVRVTRPREW